MLDWSDLIAPFAQAFPDAVIAVEQEDGGEHLAIYWFEDPEDYVVTNGHGLPDAHDNWAVVVRCDDGSAAGTIIRRAEIERLTDAEVVEAIRDRRQRGREVDWDLFERDFARYVDEHGHA
jgi:hypothetical protein